MKKTNQAYVAEKENRERAMAMRAKIVDDIGNAIANLYGTEVAEFTRPNLVFEREGMQFSVIITSKTKHMDMDEAISKFIPDNK